MSLIEWKEVFELGIHEFDEHHKYLVSLLNMAYDGVVYDASREEIQAVIDELMKYATYHFAAEEQWMGGHEYPWLAQHVSEHEQFSATVEKFRNDFHNGKANLSLDVLKFLNGWLSDHILKSDAEYGRFAKGIPYEAHCTGPACNHERVIGDIQAMAS